MARAPLSAQERGHGRSPRWRGARLDAGPRRSCEFWHPLRARELSPKSRRRTISAREHEHRACTAGAQS
eukprot:303593-Alexandrium_andersonii.AAC.1